MKNIYSKRYLSILLIFMLIMPTVLITTNIFIKKDVQASIIQENDDDRRIAADISNITGIRNEDILNLKKSGKTWNEILEVFKSIASSKVPEDISKRSSLLAGTGLDNDFIEKCKAEGFEEKDITSAKMLVERLIFQLNEIIQDDDSNLYPDFSNENKIALNKQLVTTFNNIKETQSSNDELEKDIDLYREMTVKIDIKTAVFLILKLYKEFSSMESVLDEYLYAIQIGVNLELYLVDRKVYEQEKEERSRLVDTQKLLTLAKIEAKMLDKVKIQNNRNLNKTDESRDNLLNSNISQKETKNNEGLPEIPFPSLDTTRPKDSAADAMKEINEIRNRSLNLEGR